MNLSKLAKLGRNAKFCLANTLVKFVNGDRASHVGKQWLWGKAGVLARHGLWRYGKAVLENDGSHLFL